MSSSEKWFPISSETDYHFPGVFSHPYPQRLGFCKDISTLPHYDSTNPHFLFTDIQLGKGKARNPQTVTMKVDGVEEAVCYRIVPCAGVKLCPKHVDGCSYIASTRECRPCPSHPGEKLVRSGDCPVEFVYISPQDNKDNRRWITGILRGKDMTASNLHNHPSHAASKIPSKVDTDIRQAIISNPHLKTRDIMTGKICTVYWP